MIKQSGILKWAQNNRHNNKGGAREWIHPPDTLQRGHIAYLVKFLGNTEVDQAKGIDVIKEGIRKLKFTTQIKKSEGAKPPKVEVTISIDGVAIQEPKTKRILHQYPLHRISYCADDKAEKKFFSFIAKEADSDRHMCFVFISDKLAEEITLTIGQAFDLAYRRFLETSNRDLEMRKQLMILQKRIQSLEEENRGLKQQLVNMQQLNPNADAYAPKKQNIPGAYNVNGDSRVNENYFLDNVYTKPYVSNEHSIPPKAIPKEAPLSPSQELFNELGSFFPSVGTKLENLVLDDVEDFNPRANGTTNGNMQSAMAVTDVNLLPPPLPLNGSNGHPTHSAANQGVDLFGAEPFVPTAVEPAIGQPDCQSGGEDPFGMGDFGQIPSQLGAVELENAIGALDKRIIEMRDGFSRGISFGDDDFSLENLDPFNNKIISNEK